MSANLFHSVVVLSAHLFMLLVKAVRQTIFRALSTGVEQWGFAVETNNWAQLQGQDKWGFVAKELDGSQWIEIY